MLLVVTSPVQASPPTIRTFVGPARLLSPVFGYAAAQKEVWLGDTAKITLALVVYDHGRWSKVTPPHIHGDGIDDVAFSDRRHGWIAAYDCGRAAVYLYRTSNGGRSWRSLGRPGSHSCGGGPTYLSFVDPQNGWMEPVSPNGPVGELLRTRNGGRSWSVVASLQDQNPGLPCLAPIRFVSPTIGWMGRSSFGGPGCTENVYTTKNGGKTWRGVRIRMPRSFGKPLFDLPYFAGRSGVVAATVGGTTASAVAFSTSADGGRTWAQRSLRRFRACTTSENSWPESVASRGVWWIVAGGRQPVVQVTSDSGHHWRNVPARGLPHGSCAINAVSAATAHDAWLVARVGPGNQTALFRTHDGGRTWARIPLLRK